jgi:hypothetical protein
LIGKADGKITYNDASAFAKEKDRQLLLEDRGYRFVRWLGKEIYLRPDVVIDRISRALG